MSIGHVVCKYYVLSIKIMNNPEFGPLKPFFLKSNELIMFYSRNEGPDLFATEIPGHLSLLTFSGLTLAKKKVCKFLFLILKYV